MYLRYLGRKYLRSTALGRVRDWHGCQTSAHLGPRQNIFEPEIMETMEPSASMLAVDLAPRCRRFLDRSHHPRNWEQVPAPACWEPTQGALWSVFGGSAARCHLPSGCRVSLLSKSGSHHTKVDHHKHLLRPRPWCISRYHLAETSSAKCWGHRLGTENFLDSRPTATRPPRSPVAVL